MNVFIHESARADLDDIFEWIAKDNPSAAAKVIARIRYRIKLLEIDALATMGRPGRAKGTRELIESLTLLCIQWTIANVWFRSLPLSTGARNREVPPG